MADATTVPATAGASPSHTLNQADGRLTAPQLRLLHRALDPKRMGKDDKGFAHMEAWDIKRYLLRVFGFGGYDTENRELSLVREIELPSQQGGKSRWTVVYRAQVRLIIKDVHGNPIGHWDGEAAGGASNLPKLDDAHDMAMKTASSQALKRAATNLGDQFGLSLYNDGSPAAVVVFSAAHPPEQWQKVQAPLPEPDDPPVRPEPRPEPEPEAPAPQKQQPAQRPQAVRSQQSPKAESPDAVVDRLMDQTREHWDNPLVLAQVQGEAKAKNRLNAQVQGPMGQYVKFGDLLNGRLAELAAARNEQQGAA